MAQPFFSKQPRGDSRPRLSGREARLSRQPKKSVEPCSTGQPGAAVPTWLPADLTCHLLGRCPLPLCIGCATELLVGIGQEGVGFPRIGLHPDGSFQVA